MSLATDTLAFFRTQWATAFTDSCVVKRVATRPLNATTGQYEPTFTTIYTGGCQVRPRIESDAVYGQQLVVVFDHVIHLPWDEDAPTVNDLVDVTSTQDGKLTGKQFVVRGIPTDSLITHRILLCQDNQGA